PAPTTERGVQGAVRVVPRQGGAEANDIGESRHDNLTVGLEGQGGGLVIATKVSEHQAPAAKRGVQAAVLVVARQGEVLAATGTGESRHDDLAVGLEGQGGGLGPATEARDDPAPAKRRIQSAVRVVPRQSEVPAGAEIGGGES